MSIYCDKISSDMMDIIEQNYKSIKNDPLVCSFYLDFLKKRVASYYKNHNENAVISKEIINYAIKIFMRKKIASKEIIPRYNIQCFSCRKKVFGPIDSLSKVPKQLHCPYCQSLIDFQEDYIYYDLRYMFADKQEQIANLII